MAPGGFPNKLDPSIWFAQHITVFLHMCHQVENSLKSVQELSTCLGCEMECTCLRGEAKLLPVAVKQFVARETGQR